MRYDKQVAAASTPVQSHARKVKSFSQLMQRAHLGATRVLGYALTDGTFETWEAASAIWQARLTPEENAALAWAALRALHEDHAREVANTVLGGAGSPLPPYRSPLDEAEDWTRIASDRELDAYALACCRAMQPDRRAAFLEFMQGGPET